MYFEFFHDDIPCLCCRELITQTEGRSISVVTIDSHIKAMREFQVLMILCNELLGNVLFTGKIMALACAIFGTYYVLSSYNESIFFTVFFALLSILAITFYLISCKFLYDIPKLTQERKRLCLAMLEKKENRRISQSDKLSRKYRIRAIPELGSKDGFRTLQSTSTLNFIDFYLSQVISLLLM